MSSGTSRSRRKRIALAAIALLLLGFLGLNVLAYHHARVMLHFTTGGERTRPPESLSRLQRVLTLIVGVTIPKPRCTATPAELSLPFETCLIPAADGGTLEAWHIPHPVAKGTVILFHGYSACKSSLLAEAKCFHEMGYGCWLVDFRGSGGSSGDDTTVGFREATDVARAVQFVRESDASGAPLVLYGKSMGGVAILRAIAVHGVRPQGIIVEAAFDTMLNTVRNRFHLMGIPSFPSAELLVFWGGRQTGFPAFRHDAVEYARQVDCPVLMLHGAEDPRATVEQARRVFAALPGPKTFVVFDHATHESCLAVEPERWESAAREHLAKCDGAGRNGDR